MHLILHIGPFKTGSTSIQMALDKGHKDILAQGCLYYHKPKFRERSLSTLYTRENLDVEADMKAFFGSKEKVLDWSRNCWLEFEEMAASGKYDIAILSSEHLSGFAIDPTPLIARLKAIFNKITVLFYVRDPVALFASSIQQRIRGGHKMRELPSLLDYTFPARRQIDRYIALVGIENCVVRNFSRSNLVDGDVVADFIATVSKIARPITLPLARANEGFPGAAVAWLLTMNEIESGRAISRERHALNKRFKNAPVLKSLPKIKMTDKAIEQAIQQKSRENCMWFNDTFLHDQEKLAFPTEVQDIFTRFGPVAERRVRDWVLGYLTPEAVLLLTKVIVNVVPMPRASYPKQTDWQKKLPSLPEVL